MGDPGEMTKCFVFLEVATETCFDESLSPDLPVNIAVGPFQEYAGFILIWVRSCKARTYMVLKKYISHVSIHKKGTF